MKRQVGPAHHHVFERPDEGNNKRMNRFTMRGRAKVGTQWHLCCLVHNIEKLANNGYW